MPDTEGGGPRPTAAVLLAAGEGKRMCSGLPKVMHPIGGVTLLGHAAATVSALLPEHLAVVVGHGREHVRALCAGRIERAHPVRERKPRSPEDDPGFLPGFGGHGEGSRGRVRSAQGRSTQHRGFAEHIPHLIHLSAQRLRPPVTREHRRLLDSARTLEARDGHAEKAYRAAIAILAQHLDASFIFQSRQLRHHLQLLGCRHVTVKNIEGQSG